MITTERLILRPWCESDAEDLYKYARDPQIGPAAGWKPLESVEESREIIRTVLSEPEVYAVILRSSGEAIGCVVLHLNGHTDMTDRDDEAEVGYWIGVPYWGQGLIPEAVRAIQRRAFTQLGMRALWCGYYDGNDKSRRVQEKCGFRYHHTTQGLYLSTLGETRTGHASLITREQWLEQNPNE